MKINETIDRVKHDLEQLRDVGKMIQDIEDISVKIRGALEHAEGLQGRVLQDLKRN